MAYDRYDTRGEPRGERSRWREERPSGRDWRDERGRRDERGFFERAGDQISSWFGDDDDRRSDDHRRDEGGREYHGWGTERDREWSENRGPFARGGSSGRDYNPRSREMWGGGDRDRDRDSGYRPMAGDYGRSEEFFAASGVGRGQREMGGYDRSETPWGRDDYRRTSFAGSRESSGEGSRLHDPHYHSWRERHLSELDRDYDEYRREHQSKFESDFAGWRERRQQKRGLLGQIREQMEVVGSDDKPVGTVERIAGDRIILASTEGEGGSRHSLSCTDVDRVEDNRVILELPADKAHERWRDESRGRALFEREDQGEAGPHILNRSFEGTYR